MSKIKLGFLLICLLSTLVGCGGKPKVEESVITPELRTQVMKFLEAGTVADAKASQGVSFADVQAQVVSTKAAHELTLAVWPKGLAPAAEKAFAKAIEGWDLALELWDLKINKGDDPTAPDVNGFQRYLIYGVEEMKIERYDKDYPVTDYRGKNYLPFDANIEVLVKLAGEAFGSGRAEILEALDEKSGED